MKLRPLSLLVGCSLLLGCQPTPLSVLPAAMTPERASQVSAPGPVDPQAKTGTLVLSVKWPERSYPGFSAQAIPLSTNALVIEITDSAGTRVAYETLKRTSGTLTTTREMILSVGSGYQVSVKAYADQDPTPQSEAIAQANAVGVAVTWNEVSPLKVSLAPLFAPVIAGLSAPNAGAGAYLELAGTNFDRGDGSSSVIFPSGTSVPGTLVDGKIRVAVPTGAGSGELKVKVDGILSGTSVAFRELKSLSLVATSSVDSIERMGSDGVIRTWLGDSFKLTPLASDSADAVLTAPTVTSWSNATASLGSVDASGTYQVTATQLPEIESDLVTASSGQVSASRAIVLAPPAGSILQPFPAVDPLPGSLAYNPSWKPGPSSGVAIAKFGANYLIAWKCGDYNVIGWRLLNASGTPVTPIQYLLSHTKLKEATPLVAVRGSDAVIMVRNEDVLTKLVAYQINADLTTRGYYVVDTTRTDMDADDLNQSVYLGNLASNGTNYVLGYYVYENDGYHYKTRKFSFDLVTGSLSLKTVDVSSYPVVTDGGVLRSFSADRASLTSDGANYYVRLYYDKPGVNTYFWTKLLPDGSQDSNAKKVSTPQPERFAVDATNGTTFLITSIDRQSTNNSLIYSLYDTSHSQIKGRTVIASLDGDVTDPLNYPVTALWDGTQYLVCFTRMRTLDGVPTSQPMIQAISASGALVGKAHPIESSGTKATIARIEAEGAWCTWTRADGELLLRKLKYR